MADSIKKKYVEWSHKKKSIIKIGFQDTVIMYNEDLHIKISHMDFKLTWNSFGYVLHLLRF